MGGGEATFHETPFEPLPGEVPPRQFALVALSRGGSAGLRANLAQLRAEGVSGSLPQRVRAAIAICEAFEAAVRRRNRPNPGESPALDDMTEDELRDEVRRLRNEVGELERKLRVDHEQGERRTAAHRRRKLEVKRLTRELDEFRNGDYSAALASQRATIEEAVVRPLRARVAELEAVIALLRKLELDRLDGMS